MISSTSSKLEHTATDQQSDSHPHQTSWKIFLTGLLALSNFFRCINFGGSILRRIHLRRFIILEIGQMFSKPFFAMSWCSAEERNNSTSWNIWFLWNKTGFSLISRVWQPGSFYAPSDGAGVQRGTGINPLFRTLRYSSSEIVKVVVWFF